MRLAQKHNISFKWVDGSDIIPRPLLSKPIAVDSLLISPPTNKVRIPAKCIPALSLLKPFFRDKCSYFIHLLCDKYITHKRFGGARLNYELMRIIYGYRVVKQLLIYMHDKGWITSEHSYSTWNNTSIRYCINPDLLMGDMIEVSIQTPSFNRKINNYYRERQKELSELGVNYKYVEDNLKHFTLNITSKDMDKIRDVCDKRKNKSKKSDKVEHKIKCAKTLLERIERDKGFTKLRVDRYGRFHSTVCSLKREFCDYITCNGKSIIGKDYSCFQMVLLGVACLDLEYAPDKLENFISKTYKTEKTYQSKLDETNDFCKIFNFSILTTNITNQSLTNKSNNKHFSTNNPLIMCDFLTSLPKEKWLAYSNEDLQEWFRLCLNGEIYQNIQTLAPPHLQKLSYKQFKRRVLSSIFADESEVWGKDILKIIKEHFPTVYKWIKALKQNIDPLEFKSNGKVARLMQIMESGIIFGKVVNQLRLHYPSIPITTKHDCIITIDEGNNLQTITDIMENALSEYGIKLSVK